MVEVIEPIVKVRFCTSCQATRSVEGGEIRPTRGVVRWVCRPCIERKSVSIYRSVSKEKR